MLPFPSRVRPALLALVCLISTLLVPQIASAAGLGDDAAAELNRYRVASGLAPVTLSTNQAAQEHAHYLALNDGTAAIAGLRVHTEQPGLPGFTTDGAKVASSSNIAQGPTNITAAVRSLMDVPLHQHFMLSPSLQQIAVGGEGGYWVVDLSGAQTPWQGAPKVIPYPAPGEVDVPTAFIGREVPNPLTAIPGIAPDASVGYPISLHLFGCTPQNAQTSLATAGGQNVPIYTVQPGTVVQADGGSRPVDFVLLFPQQPLQPGTTYGASITVACGSLGKQTYTWPFTTRAALDASSTLVAVSPQSSDGWQTVALALADTSHHVVTDAQLTQWKYSFLLPNAAATQPTFRPADEAGSDGQDGLIHFSFNLGQAVSADLQVGVTYDGVPTTIPISIIPSGNGQAANPITLSPIVIDPTARTAWEQTWGVATVGSVRAGALPALQPLPFSANQPSSADGSDQSSDDSAPPTDDSGS